MRFRIRYGLGQTMGGMCEWEEIEAPDEASASTIAWECACEDYQSYEGLHGLRDTSQIMEEDGIESEDEAYDVYCEERESWLDYEVEEIKE